MTLTAEDSSRTRDLSMDVAKGVGIILVVIGHAWRGLNSAGMIGDDRLFRLVDQFIYNFHMPLFFVLSGMTFQAWALRRPVADAAVSRVTRLLWPMVLWTYLFACARLAAGEHANTPLDSLAFWPLPPRDQFWFLWALFLQHLAALALIGLVTGPLPGRVWAVLAVLATLGSLYVPLTPLTFGAITYASALLTGLALGGLSWRPTGPTAFALAAAVFVGLQVLSFQLPHVLLIRQLIGITLSLAVLAMIHLLTTDRGGAPLRMLAWLGVASMGIYLAHTIFSAATRAALARVTQDLAAHMIAGTLAGIIGPLLIYDVIRRVGRPSWIGF